MAHRPTVRKTHNSLNVIQSIFSGNLFFFLCFFKDLEHSTTQQKPRTPNILISQLRSLNSILVSREAIIFFCRIPVQDCRMHFRWVSPGHFYKTQRIVHTINHSYCLWSTGLILPGIKCCTQMVGMLQQLTFYHCSVIINSALNISARIT